MRGIGRVWAVAGLGLIVSGCLGGGSDPPPPAATSSAGPAGELSEAEKSAAEVTILEAAAAGAPKRWNAGRVGYYGHVEPGPATPGASGVCRDFTHTIFIDGRARRETGRACRPPGGVWRIMPDAV